MDTGRASPSILNKKVERKLRRRGRKREKFTDGLLYRSARNRIPQILPPPAQIDYIVVIVWLDESRCTIRCNCFQWTVIVFPLGFARPQNEWVGHVQTTGTRQPRRWNELACVFKRQIFAIFATPDECRPASLCVYSSNEEERRTLNSPWWGPHEVWGATF